MSIKKSMLLNENFSTAAHKLRKLIMFDLAKRLDLDNCFRCTLKINTVNELSIEHKIAWQTASDPIRAFYNLDNIAFSHLTCNISSAVRKKLYKNRTMYKQAGWQRYYAKNSEQILKRKRERYKRQKLV